jgi:hypothetical protein
MKYPVTIALILLIASQTFSKWCLILEYQVNRDFIAKNLCVNRSTPLSCCKGKCYLHKKMANDESSQQAPGKGAQRDEPVLQVHHQENLLLQPLFTIPSITHSTRHLTGSSQEYILSFFTPPKPVSLPVFTA